jgi:hypothetical protein
MLKLMPEANNRAIAQWPEIFLQIGFISVSRTSFRVVRPKTCAGPDALSAGYGIFMPATMSW